MRRGARRAPRASSARFQRRVRGLRDEEPTVGVRVARDVRVLGVFGRPSRAGRARVVRAIGRDGFVERRAAEEDARGRERDVERVVGAARRGEDVRYKVQV